MGMDTWIWLILCIVFIVAEAATTALISVWFAVGAAAALVASIFTNSPVVQFVVFALVSAVTLAVMVPTLVKRRASKKAARHQRLPADGGQAGRGAQGHSAR